MKTDIRLQVGLILLLLMVAVGPSWAEGKDKDFAKGTMSLGGGVSFYAGKYFKDAPTSYSFGISPRFSYFFLKNLSLDASVGLGHGWDEDSDSSSFHIGLGSRYFFKRFYGGFEVLYGAGKSKNEGYFDSRSKSHSWEYNIMAGFLVPIAKNVFADFGIKYGGETMDYESTSWNIDGTASGDYEYEDSSTVSRFKTYAGVSIFF